MGGITGGTRDKVLRGGRGSGTPALFVALVLLGVGSCAPILGGGLVAELLVLSLEELFEMRRALESAERQADTLRAASRRASTRARSAIRSADAGRLAAEAAAAAAGADAELAEVQARLAETLRLTDVPPEELSAAILGRIAEIERLKREQERR